MAWTKAARDAAALTRAAHGKQGVKIPKKGFISLGAVKRVLAERRSGLKEIALSSKSKQGVLGDRYLVGKVAKKKQ